MGRKSNSGAPSPLEELAALTRPRSSSLAPGDSLTDRSSSTTLTVASCQKAQESMARLFRTVDRDQSGTLDTDEFKKIQKMLLQCSPDYLESGTAQDTFSFAH